MTHLDLRAAMAKQVQQLRFVEFEQWFPPRRDDRASEDHTRRISTMHILTVELYLDLRGCATLSL